MVTQFNTLKSYIFPIILLLSILLGGLTGYVFNQNVAWLKPFGDIFLNLIFTTIVPLIFFSVSSAIARTGSIGKLGKIFYSMTVIFLFTGIVAAVYALFVVLL
ncbi:TPA: dicarboxylate/amino acid:cation symporter, partial [Legionella pneumophila]|nr:dicarboxylate/amino acid:cation symporter [Legionella pneumophila]HAU2104098.1 dicarboxylate/amino acid:cation symporter [Legionella pneumophila]